MKLVVTTLMLTTMLLIQAAASNMQIANNEFLLYNKYYHKSRLRQWGTGWRSYGTNDFDIKDDNLWLFDPHPWKTGCYYITNEAYPSYRITMSSRNGLIMYGGSYYDDQLWKLVPSGDNDGFYYIYSCIYTQTRIAKFGAADTNCGSYEGGRHADQLWKLVPRFTADIYTDDIFHFDNRQGSTAITREISVTTGVVKSSETSVRNTLTYSMSLEGSLYGMTASAEFSHEIEQSFTSSTESSWSKTETITFTIPAHKNFKVMQHKVNFKGVISRDSCTLMTSIKIFESDGATFSDPDKFIIH